MIRAAWVLILPGAGLFLFTNPFSWSFVLKHVPQRGPNTDFSIKKIIKCVALGQTKLNEVRISQNKFKIASDVPRKD